MLYNMNGEKYEKHEHNSYLWKLQMEFGDNVWTINFTVICNISNNKTHSVAMS